MSKLVLTLCGGKYDRFRDLVHPRLVAYSRRCHAEFADMRELGDKRHPLLAKLDIYHYLGEYDRIVYVDADAIVRADCPDLFALVPEDHIGAYDEAAWFTETGDISSRIAATVRTAQITGSSPPDWPFSKDLFRFWNTGVLVVSKRHREYFRHLATEPDLTGVPGADQNLFNLRLSHRPSMMYALPACFNQMPHNRVRHYHESSYILHYAGLPLDLKVIEMQRDSDRWAKLGR